TRPEPIGEWVVADVRAVRGQVLSDAPKVELPIWSMTKSMFLFRDNPPPRRTPNVRRDPRDLRSWEIDLTPLPDQLVVDFEGGDGDHPGYKGRKVNDRASMDVLLFGEDGKLRLFRSAADLNPDNPRSKEREHRVEVWRTWLAEVEQNTLGAKQQGGDP